MPVAAVMAGGSPAVSSGSSTAIRGRSVGWKMIVFLPVRSIVITAERPTSLPVPAVVGTAYRGGTGCTMCASPPLASSKRSSGPSCVARTAMALATSMGLPPPSATIPSNLPRRNVSAPATTSASTGLGWTRSKGSAEIPARSSARWTAAASPAFTTPGSVTRRNCRPRHSLPSRSAKSATAPGPKRMVVG
jgi:hypothetical protein